ncbi:MAG: hypothetical protein VX739_08390 [Planctomycetota bacterium]|nr:hypothetical protein [Planctomycetota bacterium]
MKPSAKIFYQVTAFLGATGTFLCFIGIFFVWILYSRLDGGVKGAFDDVHDNFMKVKIILTGTDQKNTGTVQNDMKTALATGQKLRRLLSPAAKDETQLLELPPDVIAEAESLTKTLKDVNKKIGDARKLLDRMEGYKKSLLDDIKLLEPKSLDSINEQFLSAQEQCERALDFSQRIASSPQRKAEVDTEKASEEVATVSRTLNRLFGVLTRFGNHVASLSGTIDGVRDELLKTRASVRANIFYASILLKLFLIWMGSGQATLFRFGYSNVSRLKTASATAEADESDEIAELDPN